tara:strand:+ start:1309 stop:1746 length:438 start_codon:yes stop_codon:yes gene_type:complete
MNPFENIIVLNAELEYVIGLPVNERVQYLFELYDLERARKANPNLNLKDFFNELEDGEFIPENFPNIEEFNVGNDHQVDVMIDDQNILIESNSLKALRIIRNRFIENGFILLRDEDTEKMFKKDKFTKYLRVFKIINQTDPICYN